MTRRLGYSASKSWLVNPSVRPFSVTVRTTFSGTPSGIWASSSSVTFTVAPTKPGEVDDHLVGDPARVTADSGGVEHNRPWERHGAGVAGDSPLGVTGSTGRSPSGGNVRLCLAAPLRRSAVERRPVSPAILMPGDQASHECLHVARRSGLSFRRSHRRRRTLQSPRSAIHPSVIARTNTEGVVNREGYGYRQ